MKRTLSLSFWAAAFIAQLCLLCMVCCGPVRSLYREGFPVTDAQVDSLVKTHELPTVDSWSRLELTLQDGRPLQMVYFVDPQSRTVYTLESIDSAMMFFVCTEKRTR